MDAFALTPPHTTPVTAPVMLPVIAPALVQWQAQHGRNHLPWQATRDPYRVWLSEIMLQQTQVATVLGYYSRFLAALPDVAALAAASTDDVMALWSGLGYYSRARNLHRCAQAVMREHGGQFPRSAAVLATLPGIGRTTAAAIAAFCFEERSAILDANVKRVLTRVLAFEGDLAQAAQEKALWALAEQLLPEHGHDMPRYTQALMDLGATVCTPRQPACSQCPLQAVCQAHQAHAAERYPHQNPHIAPQQPSLVAAVFARQCRALLAAAPPRKRRCQCHLGRLVQPLDLPRRAGAGAGLGQFANHFDKHCAHRPAP